MPIQKTPPPGWPHTEAAKYYNSETHTIIKQAEPPKQKKEKKRGGCCGGTLVFILIVLAIAGVVVAIALDEMAENGDPAGDPQTIASEDFTYENPGWDVEATGYVGDTDVVQLVTWSGEYGIGRVVEMEPDEYAAHAYHERPLLPSDIEWTEPQFYSAFSDTFADTHWTYVESVEPGLEATATAGESSGYTVSYSIWGEDTGDWSPVYLTAGILDDAGNWTVLDEAIDPASE